MFDSLSVNHRQPWSSRLFNSPPLYIMHWVSYHILLHLTLLSHEPSLCPSPSTATMSISPPPTPTDCMSPGLPDWSWGFLLVLCNSVLCVCVHLRWSAMGAALTASSNAGCLSFSHTRKHCHVLFTHFA